MRSSDMAYDRVTVGVGVVTFPTHRRRPIVVKTHEPVHDDEVFCTRSRDGANFGGRLNADQDSARTDSVRGHDRGL